MNSFTLVLTLLANGNQIQQELILKFNYNCNVLKFKQ